MRKMKGNSFLDVMVFYLLVLGIFGWIANVVQIAMYFRSTDEFSGYIAFKIIAIAVFPVGSVLGLVDMF